MAEAKAAAQRLIDLGGPELSKHGTPSGEVLARALFLADRVGETDYSVIGPDGRSARIESKSLTVQGEWIVVANRLSGGAIRYDTYRFEKSSSFKKEGGGQDALVRRLPVYFLSPELQVTAGLRVDKSLSWDGTTLTSRQRLDMRPAPAEPDPARRPLEDESGKLLNNLALRGNGREAEYLPDGTELEWIRREAVKSNAGISDLWSSQKHERQSYVTRHPLNNDILLKERGAHWGRPGAGPWAVARADKSPLTETCRTIAA